MSARTGDIVRINVGFKYGRTGRVCDTYADGNLVVDVDGRRYEYAPSEVISAYANNGD